LSARACRPTPSPVSLHDALPISQGSHLALGWIVAAELRMVVDDALVAPGEVFPGPEAAGGWGAPGAAVVAAPAVRAPVGHRLLRSEEHTSELQSRFELVCRLLLE